MSDFIEVYDNAISDDLCDEIVKIFKDEKNSHHLVERSAYQKKADIKDMSMSLLSLRSDRNSNPRITEILEELHTSTLDYYTNHFCKKYEKCSLLENPILKNPIIWDYKVQETQPGDGYAAWHHERVPGNPQCETRFLTYTYYLNDINEGGETEFLYQKRSIRPKKGSLGLFPAEFTHVHKGNPPKKEVKYILTGWFFPEL